MDRAREQAFPGSRLALEKEVALAAGTRCRLRPGCAERRIGIDHRVKPDQTIKLGDTWLSFAKMRIAAGHCPTQDLCQLFRHDRLRYAITRSGAKDVERTSGRSALSDSDDRETPVPTLEIGDGRAKRARDGILIQDDRRDSQL